MKDREMETECKGEGVSREEDGKGKEIKDVGGGGRVPGEQGRERRR